MSGPVVVDQQPVQDQDVQPAPTPDQAPAQLPDEISLKISMLEPSAHDAKLLAQLIQQYPQYQDAIVGEATKQLGSGTVSQALAIVSGGGPVADDAGAAQAPIPDDGGLSEEDQRFLDTLAVLEPGDADLLARILRDHPELRDQILARVTPIVGDETVQQALAIDGGAEQQPAPAPEVVDQSIQDQAQQDAAVQAETGWIAAARQYNAEHDGNVSELLSLAGTDLLDEDNAAIDPIKVAALQQSLGVDADGKVGPATLSAAHDRFKTTIAESNEEAQAALPDDDIRKDLE